MSTSERPQKKSVEAFARVRSLLEEMRRGGFYADIQTVAWRAKVSRKFLYTHPDLMDEVDEVNAPGKRHLITKKRNPNNPLSKDAVEIEDSLRRLLHALGWKDLHPADVVALSDIEVRELVSKRLGKWSDQG